MPDKAKPEASNPAAKRVAGVKREKTPTSSPANVDKTAAALAAGRKANAAKGQTAQVPPTAPTPAASPASQPAATKAAPTTPKDGRASKPVENTARVPGITPEQAKAEARRQKALRAKDARALKMEAQELLKRSKQLQKQKAKRERYEEYVATVGAKLELGRDRPITPIPDLPKHHRQLSMVEVLPEKAFIRLSFDDVHQRHLYEVIEPPLEKDEPEILDFIEETLVKTLDGRHGLDPAEWRAYLEAKADDIIIDHSILVDEVSRERIKYHIVRDFLGFGPADVLMQDPLIEDISCDGPGIPIYVFHRKHESIRTNIVFPDDLTLDAFVIRLAQRSGKHISVADPLLDATLPDGSRLQATLSREVTTRGSSFTVRKFRDDPLTPPALIKSRTMSAEVAAYFWMMMQEGSSIIYAGGTASGKTTSLNAVCQFIPPEKKVVSIEDTREINLLHENWIAGLTRAGFGAKEEHGRAGAVDMYKLLEAALRQRPEYMIVGEVRGSEALTLFQAMATGHAVYSTMHADSVASAVHRLENPPINVPRIMIPMMDAMAVQVQARVGGILVRRVKEVTEVIGTDPGTGDVLTNGVFRWNPEKDTHEFTGTSKGLEHFGQLHNLDADALEAEWQQRARVLQWMADHDVSKISDVTRLIHDYYRRPDEVMRQVKRGA